MKPHNTHDEPMCGAWIMEQPDRPNEMRMDTIALARTLAWAIAALSLTLVVAGLGITWRAGRQWQVTHRFFAPATAIMYALLGALVASRQPRNPIGWIFSVEGVFVGLVLLCSSYDMVGHSMLPGTEVVGWLGSWIWVPSTILPLTFALLAITSSEPAIIYVAARCAMIVIKTSSRSARSACH